MTLSGAKISLSGKFAQAIFLKLRKYFDIY